MFAELWMASVRPGVGSNRERALSGVEDPSYRVMREVFGEDRNEDRSATGCDVR
ncbi:MAG: hypothetical protein AAGA96_14860 [Verrucomicrobiota bacterium]